MATMKVVIVDPYTSQPLKGVVVEAHDISDGSFISTAITNDYGVAEFSLTVDASFHARTANTPPLYQPVVPRTPTGIMNVDYVVASDASGTHTTLTAAVAAVIAAGGNKTIWLCHSVTESDIDIGGLASSAKITIASHSQQSVTITANVNEDIFKQDSNGGDGGGGLYFRNVGFSIPSAGRAIYDVNTGGEINELKFDQCKFNGEYLARQDGSNSLNDVDIEVRDCTGTLAGFYKVAGASATYSPKLLYVYGCTLGLTEFWDGGSTNAAPEENALIRSSVLSITNGLTFPTGNWEGHTFSDLFIFFAGAGALFTTSAASASLEDFTFQNITVRFSNSSGTFGVFGSASINNNDGLFLDGIYGHMSEGVGAGGTFITVDTDWLNVYVGDIFGKDFATQYSGPPITPSPAPPHLDFFNGTFVETLDADISEAGGVVTLSLQAEGGGDLTMRFSSGLTTLPTPKTIALTLGDDDSPQMNYIYVLESDQTQLTKSTSGWPAAEHIKVGTSFIPSAAFVAANGPIIQQQWNDHRMGTDNMGHMAHMAERERLTAARYFSGIDPNGTTSYLTILGATVYFKATSGIIYQMHPHASAAVNTDPGGAGDIALVVNWNGDAFHDINNLFDIVDDSGGNTIGNNKWFNLVFWGVANKTGTYEPIMINLPAGFYNTQASAEQDISGFDNFDLPREFDLESSTGFLIARITVKKQAGTWTFGSVVDLRRGDLLGARGGASSPETEFSDNALKVFNVDDNTKVFKFLASLISPNTTRTLTVPDASGTIALTPNLYYIPLGMDISGAPITP